ncbi:uncharacterized protein EV154DRAFT_598006 [Mucor mucedo]|uniref:uncharacterized protein n=1 Tax=Mucor mucedo TaxID=29922 RepID=UPI00221EDE56|nr:uncharacterized protein EV154DRAFT_598006 [Mucor mucedo]KAI7896767.1 hypothetical protein EV154DRAFT_598006 [Mucor mucedo]
MNPKIVEDFEKFMLVLDKSFQKLLTVIEELMQVWKKTFLKEDYAEILFKKGYMLHFYYLRYLNTVSEMCEGCKIVFSSIIHLSGELQRKKTVDTISVIRLTMEVENISNVLRNFSNDSAIIKDDTFAFHLGIVANDFLESLNLYSCTAMALLAMGAVYTGLEGAFVLGAVGKCCLAYQNSRDHYEIRDAVKKLHEEAATLIGKTHRVSVLMNTTTQYINGLSSLTDKDLNNDDVVEVQAAHVARIGQSLTKRLTSLQRAVHKSQDLTSKFICFSDYLFQ